MKRITVFITDPQAEALTAEAQQHDIPFAEMLRRILDAYLTTQDTPEASGAPNVPEP